jgi:hypothetical protein
MLIEHLIYSTALAIFIGMIHYRFFNRDYSWIIIVSAYVPDLDVISDSLLKKMGITVLIYGHTIVHGYFHNIAILTLYAIFVGTVSKASEKRIFRDLLSRLIDQIEEPAPGFA